MRMTQAQRLTVQARVAEVFRDLWARGEREGRLTVAEVAELAGVTTKQARAALEALGAGYVLEGDTVCWKVEG
jgi:Fic family protein